MSLVAVKAAGLAVILLMAGLPVYLANRAPGAALAENTWATPDDTPVFEIAWLPAGDALHGIINPAVGGVNNIANYSPGEETVSRLTGYRWATAIAVATNVREGTMTSSPAAIPRAWRATSKATLPLASATAWEVPTYAANSSSNLRPSGPVQ